MIGFLVTETSKRFGFLHKLKIKRQFMKMICTLKVSTIYDIY